MNILMIPFIIQAIVIFLDEFFFHVKRGLPKWERVGHPIDTLSVLICLAYALFVPYSPAQIKVYVALAIVSCVLVTKDEFVHKHHCPASEQWLHAFLFLNHPVVLTATYLMWANIETHRPFLLLQGIMIFIFMLYQIIYWNFIWKEKKSTNLL